MVKKKQGAFVGASAATDKIRPVDAGEFWHLCEGFPENACMVIALNIHFGRRVYNSLEEFAGYLKKLYN